MTDTRKIALIGGSNSVKRNGWTRVLQARPAWVNAGYALMNLSAGANSSLMGLGRLLDGSLAEPPAAVLWEYALNDVVNLAYDDAMTCEVLLANVERTVRECLARDIPFVPVILRSRPNLGPEAAKDYYDGLAALWSHYDVMAADATPKLRALAAAGVHEVYSDELHLAPGRACLAVAKSVLFALKRARVPADVPPLHLPRGVEHVFVDAFGDAERVGFQNSLLSLRLSDLGPEGLRSDPLPGKSGLLGVSGLCYRLAGPISVSAGQKRVHLMTSPRAGRLNPQLRMIPLASLLGRSMPIAADAPIEIAFSDADDAHAASNFLPNRRSIVLERTFRLQGLLLERRHPA